MFLRSDSAWRKAAFLAVLASAGLARADWYTWRGTTSDYGDDSSWQSQTDPFPFGMPGVNDNVQISAYTGSSTSLILGQDYTHAYGQFQGIDLDLGGHTYTFSGTLESYGSSVHDGTLNARVFNALDDSGFGPTSLTNIQGTFDSLGVTAGGTLNLTNSTIATNNFSNYGGGSISLTNTSVAGHYGELRNATIDADSSIGLDADGLIDIYAVSLRTSTGMLTLNGALTTVGSTMGFGNGNEPSRTDSQMRITSTGSWKDTSVSVNSLGFGGDFTLDVDGGTVELGDVNIGEGNYNGQDNSSLDGKGFVIVENGGSFSAKNVILGGWARNAFAGSTTQVASGSGDVIVRDGGTFTADSVKATDLSGLNRGSSSLYIDNRGIANVGLLLGGATTLDSTTGQSFFLSVNNGGTYKGDTVGLVGSPGKTVTATFLGTNTTVDVQHLVASNLARITANGVGHLTVSELRVGDAYSNATTNANIKIENGNLRFENKSVPADGDNSVWAVNGDIELNNVDMTVAANQNVSFQAGAGLDASGNGRLSIVDSSFDGLGGLNVGAWVPGGASGSAYVGSSNLNFRHQDNNGNLFASQFGVGNDGYGYAIVEDSTIDAYRFRTGGATGGNSDVVFRNSTITAHSNQFTTTSPGSIMVGVAGKSKVELFNSNLNGQRIYIGTQGLLKGDGRLNGDPLSGVGTTVENHGTISPGHSPGKLSIDGDLFLTSTSVLEMEIDLSNPSSFDQILTTGDVSLGGIFRLKAIGAGTFDPTLSYTFLTGASFTGRFSSFEIDPIFGITSSAFTFNGGTFGINPQAVPEPASFAALAVGMAVLLRKRRMRK